MNFAMAEMKVAVAMILKRYVLLNFVCLNEFWRGHPYKKDEDVCQQCTKKYPRGSKILFSGRGVKRFHP